MEYNLEERTAKFGEKVILLVKKVKLSSINSRIISQIVASSGSVGANYCEANGSESKKDFVHKLRISLKEIKETKHWARLLSVANPEIKVELVEVWTETSELFAIFSKIIQTCSISSVSKF